jgi:hypothetical protein
MTRLLVDGPNVKMRLEAMDLARRGASSEEIRAQMLAWSSEAAERAVEWAAREDARMEESNAR